MNIKVVVASMFFTAMTVFGASVSAAAKEPHEVVQETVDQVIERIQAERETLRAEPDKVFEVINDLILPKFNFPYMARVVLGKTAWKNSSKRQRADFTDQFTNLLVRTYAKALLGYSEDYKVIYLDTISKPNSPIVLVKTEIEFKPGTPATPVNYWLRKDKGDWKVINVAFQGVNLVKTYRQDFATVVKTEGLDSLIRKLTEKNEKLATTALE